MTFSSTTKIYLYRVEPIFVLIMLMFSTVTTWAGTFYVATNGSDSNPGTSAAPFLTLNKAANTAVAGDTVIVQNGTYGNAGAVTGGDSSCCNYSAAVLYNSGTPSAWITFKAANKWGAVLDCQMLCDSYINLRNASYIVIQDFVITRGYKEGIHSNDAAHHIVLRGNRFEYIANRNTSTPLGLDGMYTNPNCHDFVIDGNVFHDIGRTNNNALDHGLYVHGTNFTITNNIFYSIPHGWSIQAADGLNNALIANNTFAFPNGGGQNGQIMLWNTITGLTIRNNIFYNPQNYAITTYQASLSSCTIDHNLISGASGVISSSGCSVGTNTIGGSPQFVNASNTPYDFHVTSGGAGVDAGVNLSAASIDFDGVSRPQGSSTDMGAYELSTTTTRPPPVISGIFVSNIQPDSVVVNWSTDTPSTSYVQYGLSAYTNTTAENTTLVTTHSVVVSGLTASTLYHFRVGSRDAAGQLALSADSTFTTASQPVSATIALSAGSTSLSVTPGSSVFTAFTASLVSGSPFPVTFSTSPLPAGLTASFASSSCTVTCSTTMSLAASQTASSGTFNMMVTASGAATASVSISVNVGSGGSGSTDTLSGLTAQWKMAEGSGNLAYDSSGNVNTATLYNPTWWTSDYGTTVWFSGSNSYGVVNESSSLQPGKQLTVAFWLRPSSNSNTDPRIITKSYDWDVKLNGSNRYPQFSAGGQYALLNYSLPLITWHHVAFTFSNGIVAGYVDGMPAPMITNTFTGSETIAQWAYGLLLATDPSGANAYIGSLDDVRIYSRALTADDIAAVYSELKAVSGTSPRGGGKRKR